MERPALEVADVFRAHGPSYRRKHRLRLDEHKVMRAIERCRTAALGGHVDACQRCGACRISYNSCRNRFCPKCQGLARQAWVEAREAELLPIEYFHIVFTLPHALLPLLHYNRALLLNLLFRSASRTLREFGRRHLKGEIGVLAVLHTWGQTLSEHPHVHCIVTGGALSADPTSWTPCRNGFLFPVRALSEVFRGKYIDALKRAHRSGTLRFGGEVAALGEPEAFGAWIQRLYAARWIVYAKRPFAGAHRVVRYLGRYTHRGPIASSRLVSLHQERVRFRWKDYRAQGQVKGMELSAEEFIRRYLQHVLPQGFVRIRGYGLYANAGRAKRLEHCRALLDAQLQGSECDAERSESSASASEPVTTKSPCGECGSTRLVRQAQWHAGERPPILCAQVQVRVA
jgi:hypothetical protein